MQTYQLLVDVWEGQLEVDEATLRANGVAGMLIRLNDMNGGHHMDTNFAAQWAQAEGFARAPYFVYNPWVSGLENYNWLRANMPSAAGAVMIDIEVRKDGYSPATYAFEVQKFIELAKTQWKTAIYTGQWFLSYLSVWPKDVDYWWAQYPYTFYPASVVSMTWNELRAKLDAFTGPINAMSCPGPLRMWQFTGDKLILPGCVRPIDVNAFFGTAQDLAAWLGMAEEPEPPAEGHVVEVYVDGVLKYREELA
jgi:GH25 family lysozyme M1 (1,4-beta-N-acetylmuramidase)